MFAWLSLVKQISGISHTVYVSLNFSDPSFAYFLSLLQRHNLRQILLLDIKYPVFHH